MAWISITEDDVKSRLAGTELTAYKSRALASGQTDPVAEIITQVVDEMRGYIAACQRNTLEEGAKIPQKLKSSALALIVYRLITRLPVSVSQARRDENQRSIELMKEVAACKFAIEEPTTAATEAISSPSPKTSRPDRNFSRENQDGV